MLAMATLAALCSTLSAACIFLLVVACDLKARLQKELDRDFIDVATFRQMEHDCARLSAIRALLSLDDEDVDKAAAAIYGIHDEPNEED